MSLYALTQNGNRALLFSFLKTAVVIVVFGMIVIGFLGTL